MTVVSKHLRDISETGVIHRCKARSKHFLSTFEQLVKITVTKAIHNDVTLDLMQWLRIPKPRPAHSQDVYSYSLGCIPGPKNASSAGVLPEMPNPPHSSEDQSLSCFDAWFVWAALLQYWKHSRKLVSPPRCCLLLMQLGLELQR